MAASSQQPEAAGDRPMPQAPCFLGPHRLSPLHVAVWSGDVELVKAVLDSAPMAKDDRLRDFGSAAHLAPAIGATEIVNVLMGAGASFLQRDACGQRSLAYLLPLAFHDLKLSQDATDYFSGQSNDAILARGPDLAGAFRPFHCPAKWARSRGVSGPLPWPKRECLSRKLRTLPASQPLLRRSPTLSARSSSAFRRGFLWQA